MSLEGPFVSTALLLIVGVASSSKTRVSQVTQAVPSEKDEDPALAVSASDAPPAPAAD